MKWASLNPGVQAGITEDERRRDQGGNSLQRKTALQARTRLGVGKGTRQVRKALRRDVGIDSGAPKRFRATTFKDRVRLKKMGRRGRRLKAARDPWKRRIFAIHGERCIYPGCTATTGLDVMHAYSKGAHPEWHVADFNGFIGCRLHHTGAGNDSFEFGPHLKQALMACADEMHAAADGRRPQPSWEELQSIILTAIQREQRRKQR